MMLYHTITRKDYTMNEQSLDIRKLFADGHVELRAIVDALKNMSDVMPEEASGECAYWRMDIEAAIYWLLVWNRNIPAAQYAPDDKYLRPDTTKPLGKFIYDYSKIVSVNFIVGEGLQEKQTFKWTTENSFSTEEDILRRKGIMPYVRYRKDYFESLNDNILDDEGYHELRILNHLRRIRSTMPDGHEDWKVAVDFSIKLFELITRTAVFIPTQPNVVQLDKDGNETHFNWVFNKPLCVLVKQIMHKSGKIVVYNPRGEYGYELIEDKMSNPDRLKFDDDARNFVK